jgi:8-amino-7-oxononanoate synthase
MPIASCFHNLAFTHVNRSKQPMRTVHDRMSDALRRRAELGNLRSLTVVDGLIDFASNDYLGFASRPEILNAVDSSGRFGSTGSRLLTGNSRLAGDLERQIASFYEAPAGLLFNSGYDANLGLMSCIAERADTILYDQFVHASLRDGIRLSPARSFHFRHNDLDDLRKKIRQADGRAFIVVESVYSMDGDSPNLVELAEVARQHQASLIVDEAHATGVFGKGGRGRVTELDLQDVCFARIHTFGKALGCHGAIVLGSETLRQFLINFCRPFIYTTFLPDHSLYAIRSAYEMLNDAIVGEIRDRIGFFVRHIPSELRHIWIPSHSAIQCFLFPGNARVKAITRELSGAGFDVRPVLHPTVPEGKERIRICLHVFNGESEIERLLNSLLDTWKKYS